MMFATCDVNVLMMDYRGYGTLYESLRLCAVNTNRINLIKVRVKASPLKKDLTLMEMPWYSSSQTIPGRIYKLVFSYLPMQWKCMATYCRYDFLQNDDF